MMKLSIITNSISSVAQSAAVHIKNLCINSKVDAVFRITVRTAQTHPFVTMGLSLAAIYCCRGRIETLINKVNNATQFLYGSIKNSITNATNFFKRDSTSEQTSSSSLGKNSAAKVPVSETSLTPEFSPSGT